MTLEELLTKATNLTSKMSTESLLELWLKTTKMDGIEVPYIRGWVMDELESRFPRVYGEWLDTDECFDEDLARRIRESMKGGHRK